jgi:PAS domain S-box-containing protein
MTQGGNILVVDDEPEALQLLAGILTSGGYRVRPADSGKLALASVAAERPELILLDIRMPGMGGFEVCQRLKACENSRDIPVIFVSAGRDVVERVEGLRLGAVDFVSKLFHPEEILARVRTHLELGRLRAQLERRVAERTEELRSANEQLQRELTQRIRAEHALHESEERFRHIADSVPVIIWVSGPDGANTFFNKQASVFTGRTIEELRGTGWQESVHPEDQDRRSLLCIKAFQGQQDFQLEYRLRRADGEYRWVLSTGVGRFINGSYAGHVGTIIDIMDLKRNHERMLETQKLESMGVLAAGIAHDFNNLLCSIFGETDLALLDVPQDSPARESIERIGDLAIRASEIVKLLMAYAGDGCEIVSEPVDLGYLVAEMLQLLKLSISKKAVMKVNLAKDLPAVQANAPQIRQVVMNLVTNASEALGDREGVITVTTRRVHIRQKASRNGSADRAEGDYVRLEVSDTGCGMTEETQTRAFDPFYTTKFLGRGLGLAAIQGIVRGHRGAINIVSEPGRGSTFEVLLPCAEQPADEPAPALYVSSA